MEEDTEADRPRHVNDDVDILEIAPIFYFLSSLDKVFSDVHLCTIPYKKTRENCEEISINNSKFILWKWLDKTQALTLQKIHL